MEKKKIIYIICFIIYLIVVFVTEIFYRNKLYDISVDYEEKIKQTGALNKFYFFWSSIFIYLVLGLGTIVVLILYPYNVFLSYVTIEVTLYFIMCLFKSVYANSRPYWNIYYEKYKNTNFSSKPTECDGEFGNPSGHSLLSIATLFLTQSITEIPMEIQLMWSGICRLEKLSQIGLEESPNYHFMIF